MSIDHIDATSQPLSPQADLKQKLRTEHDESIVFADQIITIAQNGSDEEVTATIAKIHDYNHQELEVHLQHEERTILRPMVELHREHKELCVLIGQEHGYIRTLVEKLRPNTDDSREQLATFGELLKSHTILEDEQLFPLVDALFSNEQKHAIADFEPFKRKMLSDAAKMHQVQQSVDEGAQIVAIKSFLASFEDDAPSVMLLPRFDPQFLQRIARHLDMAFFDFRQDVMSDFGTAADSVDLELLDESIRQRAHHGPTLVHNVEALLCVKSEAQRRAWLQAFLETQWPHSVIVPIVIYLGDVPKPHPRVFDLALH